MQFASRYDPSRVEIHDSRKRRGWVAPEPTAKAFLELILTTFRRVYPSLVEAVGNLLDFREDTHHVPTQNLLNVMLTVPSIQQTLRDHRVSTDILQLRR